MNIICVNYCETQLSAKQIIKFLLNENFAVEDAISRPVQKYNEYIDMWKTNRRLTVKLYKKTLFIYTNGDGFKSLSNGAFNMAENGDDVELNDYSPHYHFDWDENTSKSEGLTLYYWHNV